MPHAVGTAGGYSYYYDADGNMTSGGGRTLTWTSFNQFRTVAQNGVTSEFWFGAGHERVVQPNTALGPAERCPVIESQVRVQTLLE